MTLCLYLNIGNRLPKEQTTEGTVKVTNNKLDNLQRMGARFITKDYKSREE
jgi:hypothetical protein